MRLFKKVILLLAIAWGLITLSHFYPIQAQLNDGNNHFANSIQLDFKPPTVSPTQGTPTGRQKGAGSHSSSCQMEQSKITPLIALVPEETESNQAKSYVWGRTVAPQPTLWFYVAYFPNTNVKFELQNEQEYPIYKASFKLEGTPGIVNFTLPPTIVLETGKRYLWYFYVLCHSQSSPDNFVAGWVERVASEPPLESQLTKATLEQIALYANRGIWYDTLTSLDRLRLDEPNSSAIASLWTRLLQQVGLDEVAQEPVVQRYSIKLGSVVKNSDR